MLAAGLFLNGEVERGECEGDVRFRLTQSRGVVAAIQAIRICCLLGIYSGVVAVLVSIHTIEHPDAAKKTPEFSVTMQCVLTLVDQYFAVYLLLFVTVMARQAFGVSKLTSDVLESLDTARATLVY